MPSASMAAPTQTPLSNASNKFPLAIQRLPHRATPCRDVITLPVPLSRLNTTPSLFPILPLFSAKPNGFISSLLRTIF